MSLFYHLLGAGIPTLEDVVTVTTQNITHGTSGAGGAKAGIRFNVDGTVDKREGATYTQISASTDWVVPQPYADTYHIKWEAGSGACDVTPFAASTWTAMAAGPYEWREEEDSGSADSASVVISISNDGGSTTLDSATITLTADDTP